MLKGSWKKYFKGLDQEIQYKVEFEIREGLENESFSLEDMNMWSFDDFVMFVDDVKSWYSL